MNKSKKKLLVIIIITSICMFSSISVFAANIPESYLGLQDWDHTRVVGIKDIDNTPAGDKTKYPSGKHPYRFTNSGAMQLVGTTAYCIKPNQTLTQAYLFTINNATDKSKAKLSSTVKVSGSLGKANGMAYNSKDGLFYVATHTVPGSGSQIIAINKSGKIQRAYNCSKRVTSITYYKNIDTNTNQFIIGENQTENFHLLNIDGSKSGTATIVKSFVINPANAVSSTLSAQDIEYQSGYLYTPITINENGVLKRNKILKINFAEALAGNKIEYTILKDDSSTKSSLNKYEVESIDFYGGKMYASVNAENATTKGYDGIYYIYKRN